MSVKRTASDKTSLSTNVITLDDDDPEVVCLSSSPGSSSSMFSETPSDGSRSSMVNINDAVAAILSKAGGKSPNFSNVLEDLLSPDSVASSPSPSVNICSSIDNSNNCVEEDLDCLNVQNCSSTTYVQFVTKLFYVSYKSFHKDE